MQITKRFELSKSLLSTIIILFFFLSGCTSAGYLFSRHQVVYAVEEVIILTEHGVFPIEASVDTGAFRSSIDAKLALKLMLEQDLGPFIKTEAGNHCKPEEVFVESALGDECRMVVKIAFEITTANGSTIVIHTNASVADRGALRYPMLVGRRDLKGDFLVNTSIPDYSIKEAEEKEKD